jgi:CubicO group peptidase (beta-lactamase class C family)
MRLSSVALLLGVLPCYVRADDVSDVIQATVRDSKVPGIAIAVVKNGRVARFEKFGYANVQHKVPVMRETKFELASLSKQFTAVLALMLVDDGKLALDAPLSKFFPNAPEKWGSVQVQHLMNHSAGFPEFAVVPPRYSSLTFFPYTRKQQLDDMWAMTPAFQAGSKFQYSNVGYQLLGHVIEAAGGAPYDQQLKQRILDPLEMKNSGFIDRSAVIPLLSEQYTLRNNALARWSIAETMGAFDFNAFGGLYSTVDDLAKWEAAIHKRSLLKPNTWERAFTPFKTANGELPNATVPYASGWTIHPAPKGRLAIHSGHTGTAIVRNVDTGESVITLSNLGIGNPKPFGNDQGFPVTSFTTRVFDMVTKGK